MTFRISLAVLGVALFIGWPSAAVQPFDPFGVAGVDQNPGAQVPLERPFRDAEGVATTLRSVAKGRPILIAPIQLDCPNLCGLTLEGLGAAIGDQDYRAGDDFALVVLSIDPREGPPEARASAAQLIAALPAGMFGF